MNSRTNDLLSFLAAIGLSTGAAIGSVVHVDDDAPAAGDGRSWATAYRFLQDALTEAEGGDVTEIRVAQGLYRPDRDELNPTGTGARPATFQLVDGVLLAGGYAGIGAPDPDERDVSGYVTTLSGDLLGDDGPDFANNDDNSWHVVTGSGNVDTAIIDGVTITAGNASGPLALDKSGGGMISVAGSPAVRSSTFIGNVAEQSGGALHFGDGSSAAISNCWFIGNRAEDTRFGGGAIGTVSSVLTITGGVFFANSTWGEGGAMATIFGTTTISNSTLIGNEAKFLGGGGLCTSDSGGVTYVANCINFGNIAPADPQIFNIRGGETRVSWSNTEGGLDGIGVFDDGGNIDADPLLDEDGRPQAGSPSIDAGNNDDAAGITEDLDGHPRFVDDPDTKDTGSGDPPIVDMGAYEFQVCPGDLDGSGDVDFGDILRVLDAWGNEGGPEDIDGSGTVDFNDLLIVLDSWGSCT